MVKSDTFPIQKINYLNYEIPIKQGILNSHKRVNKEAATFTTFRRNMAASDITHLFLCQPLKDFFDMPNQKTKLA